MKPLGLWYETERRDVHIKSSHPLTFNTTKSCYATCPLSRCYLLSYLVKNTAGAHKDPSKKYKNHLEEQATSDAELNTSITRVKN